jgi:hypothetical protein
MIPRTGLESSAQWFTLSSHVSPAFSHTIHLPGRWRQKSWGCARAMNSMVLYGIVCASAADGCWRIWKIWERHSGTGLGLLIKRPFSSQIETCRKNAVDSIKLCKESREEIKVKKRCYCGEFLYFEYHGAGQRREAKVTGTGSGDRRQAWKG